MSSEINRFESSLPSHCTECQFVNEQLKTKNAQIRALEERVENLTTALAQANSTAAHAQKEAVAYKDKLTEASKIFKEMFPQIHHEQDSASIAPELTLRQRVDMYEGKLKNSPLRAEILFELAVAYFELEEYEKALNTFKQPDAQTNWLTDHYIARIYAKLSDYKNALDHIELAIQKEPTKSIASNYILLAHIALQAKLADKVRVAIKEAIRCHANVTQLEAKCAKLL